MAKAKPKSQKSRTKTTKPEAPSSSKQSARKAAEGKLRKGSVFAGKGRSYGAIFIIVIMVLSTLVVVLGAMPGMEKEKKAEYGVRAFFYNANHTAEKSGHTEYAMYLGNTGNGKDTFLVKAIHNAGNFDIWFGIFSVDSQNNAGHLAEGSATIELIDMFQDNGQTLTNDATVTVVDDNNWIIEDGYIEYKATRSLNLLNVYQYGQAKIPVNEGRSKVMVVAADASSRAKGLNYAEIQVRSLSNSATKTTIRFNVQVVDNLGEPITKDDSVGMYYTGMLTEGTIFDSNVEETMTNTSIPRKKDYSNHFDMFDLKPSVGEASVIEGWQKGVPGLKNSETKVIRIPAKLAYGDTGDHNLAGEELIFEITLGAVY